MSVESAATTFSRMSVTIMDKDVSSDGNNEGVSNKREDARLPCIEGFFCKILPDTNLLRGTIESVKKADASDKDEKLKELESLLSDTVEVIDPHKEAQELRMLLNRRRVFEVSIHSQPTFQHFSDCMRNASERNVRNLHFSGHGKSRWGFFWLKQGALEYDNIPIERFVRLFETEVAGAKASSPAHGRGTVECVFLNACHTEDLGKKLREAGVPHVVCWRSEVYDSTALAFTNEFYASFEENKNYKLAFWHAVNRMDWGGGAARAPQRHLARGAVDYVCLLSINGNACPETGHIRGDTQRLPVENDGDAQEILQGSEDEGDAVRNWRKPRNKTDYAALAGRAERDCMVLLGFQMTLRGDTSPIRVGKGIEPNGFITDQVLAMWGVRKYTSDVWGSTKKAVGEAKKLLSSPQGKSKVSQAILKLKEVEDYRKKDMARHVGVCPLHEHQLKQIEETRKALEALKSPFNLSAIAHALPTAAAATRSAPEGIEHACSVVEEQSGVDTRQSPTDSKLSSGVKRKIPDQASAQESEQSNHCCQLIEYLKGHFTEEIAAKICSKLGIVKKESLFRVSQTDINGLGLNDCQQEELTELVNEAKILQLAVAGAVSLKERDLNDSDLSGADTSSEGEDDVDFGWESVAIKHAGNPEDFQEHMRGFIQTFLDHLFEIECEIDESAETFSNVLDLPKGEWTFCMFVWIRFAKEAYFDETSLKRWCECIKKPAQNTLLALLEWCLKQESTRHTLWSRSDLKSNCNKEFSAGIYVTDLMVRHHLKGHAASLGHWERYVVKGWFEPENVQDASVFLLRANKFLREHVVDGIQIVENVVKTQSFVAFLRMSKLASLLLFEYLEVRKLEHNSSQGPAGSESLLFQGFSMFISSSNRIFSLTVQDVPVRRVMPMVRQGLKCLVRLPAEAWEMMGPVSTAKDFLSVVAAKSRALSSKTKDDAHQKGGPDDKRSAAEFHDKNRKEVENIYNDDVSRAVILKYLEALRETWGHYIDSASGERRRVDGQAVSLVLLKSTCFHDICDSDDATIQGDLKCPISISIMTDPVECSDGCTYERKEIEECFEVALQNKEPCKSPLRANKNEADVSGSTAPKASTASELKITELEVKLASPGAGLSEQILDAQQEGVRIKWCKSHGYGDARQVWCKPNTEIMKKITEFMKKKAKEQDILKQSAEGEEERRIFRSRLGHGRDGDSTGSEEGGKTNPGEQFDSAEKFLKKLFATETSLACLTGPPASGKTVTMQQLACTHAATTLDSIQMQKDLPLLPVFMRAAELPKLLSDNDKRVESMRELIELYIITKIQRGTFDAGMKGQILELFDLDHVLICIDGLDEAAQHQDLVEGIIDDTVRGAAKENRNLHILLSTREHSYRHSRSNLRLEAFDVVNLQPLDKRRQRAMINDRLSTDQVGTFLEQLEAVAGENPELATSPFLLSLILEVYKKEGVIPTRRVELYPKQVEAIVLRCIHTQIHGQGGFEADADALEVCTDYLGALAFVCQMRLEKRDFALVACARDVQELWLHSPDLLTRARELMFGNPIVGLLTVVGDNVYRFSHLTLQEYLAAKCAVRLFGHNAKELLNQLQPLHSLWKRMVLQFTACMLSEQVFEGFCKLVLASDDGTGSHCELVQDFLKERGASEKVERMVRDKLHEIRGTERLIAGLCHPSSELRHIVLSEMKKFGVPPDPFADTDGTAAALRQIAEDGASKWHKRAAAVLSLVQMAQMDHCREGNGRSDTLQWLLAMLKDQIEDILYALVTGLGTLLKRVEKTESKDEIILVAAEDEPVLLAALKQSANGVVVEAMADLKAYSDGLMDWVSNESNLIAEGVWPMRHLLHVFCIKTATWDSQSRAEKLGQQLFGRVHAVSEKTFNQEQDDMLKGLNMICQAMRDDRLPLFLPLLQSGQVKQRSRVMQVAAALGMQFVSKSRESLDTLAQALLSDVVEGCTLAGLMEGGSLLAALLRDESDRKHESLRESSKVFVYLMESFGPAADQGLEVPKRCVDFLVEFEKNHVAAATAAARIKACQNQVLGRAKVRDPVEKWNVTDAVQKSEETNPEEKRKDDKVHSEHLSLESLAAAVEDFTPKNFSTSIRQHENPVNLYCAARLWATSGLMQERTSEEIAAWLSLSESMAKKAQDDFSNFQGLKKPWVSGHGCKDGRWLQHVLEGMRDETPCRGRFMFASFLEHIRQCSMKDMSWSGREEIEEHVKQWQPSGAKGHLEQLLLLKEVRIGRRSQELPSWTGVVSAINCSEQKDGQGGRFDATSTPDLQLELPNRPAEIERERAITKDDIRMAKKQGQMSLSIHLIGEEDANSVKDEINWWGDRLKEAFQQLEMGDVSVIEKDTQDRRVQVELRGSEKRDTEIQEWLKKHDYFREKEQQSTNMKEWLKKHGYSWKEKDRPHRLLFTLWRGQEEVVVVEGRSAPDKVGVITVFRAKAGLEFSNVGHQFDTQEFAVHFYNHDYTSLLLDLDADALALDAALTEQGRARIDAASGVWVIGPGTTKYSLSTWPASKPFLLAAAGQGRANFVERLTRHYGCDVNYLDKDRNTALHLAAYNGHADVVVTLLDSGLISDLTIKNKFGETALDCAKAGQKAYDKKDYKGPKSPALKNSCIDFTTRNGWPGWGEITRLLEAAGSTKHSRSYSSSMYQLCVCVCCVSVLCLCVLCVCVVCVCVLVAYFRIHLKL